MKKIFTLLCVVTWLVCHISCREDIVNSDALNEIHANEQKVQVLVGQIREGNVEAYKDLAMCYRDGIGVERSWVNMLASYVIYSERSREDLLSVLTILDEKHPIKLIVEVLSSSSNDVAENKLKELEEVSPADAKAIRIVKYMPSNGVDDAVLAGLMEAEDEGSELAALIQAMYYEEMKNGVAYEQCLSRLVERFPVLYNKMGKWYMSQYEDGGDVSNVQKAVEYYCKAEMHGMLTPWNASRILELYEHLHEKGTIECDGRDIERLNKIADTK